LARYREIKGMIERLKGLRLEGIHRELLDLKESFMDMAGRFASIPGTVLLMSGGTLDCARYHILGTMPWLIMKGRHNALTLRIGDETKPLIADPFDILQHLLHHFQLDEDKAVVPFATGLMGYLAYDLKDMVEVLPRTSIDDLGLPHIYMTSPTLIVVHDNHDDKTWINIPVWRNGHPTKLQEVFYGFKKRLSSRPEKRRGFYGNKSGFHSNFEKEDYYAAIRQISAYITSGHVYQVNMSQRFQTDFQGDPFTFFKRLFERNPAPFFAYIHAGDHHVISTSPERFILRTGDLVEARPIKGTRPRGLTPQDDRVNREDLLESKKDDAELSMIVDLLRNDIGKVCKGGAVRVAAHRRLEAYENVYHLVSIVEGRLKDDVDSVDLIKAAFPGGSITGCPKIRAMEIIDELEPNRRHVYTGSIGYISFHKTMDLNIAIRTATIHQGKMVFSVGGGVVYDSDPAEEYEETLHKGKTLMEIIKGERKQPGTTTHVWINGAVKPVDEAKIPITDLGFQYGFGFFETLRFQGGRAQYLDRHLERFNSSWRALFGTEIPDLTWDDIILQVAGKNGIGQNPAIVKIMASWGSLENKSLNPTLAVTVRPYVPRFAGTEKTGVDLLTYPEPRQTPLASHKTFNYLYYYLAGKWAGDEGADEALILNSDGTVSETNTANILLVKKKMVIRPRSTHALPGIMQKVVCEHLLELGYEVRDQDVRPEDLLSFDGTILTNSLIGAVPVVQLDHKKLTDPTDLCRILNQAVLTP
jgi:para-aminobenzoate synthetase component 1